MTKRIRTAVIGIGAASVLAIGGAGFAQAQSGPEPVGGPDRDSIQSGDQTTPDTAAKTGKVSLAAASTSPTAPEAPGAEQPASAETPGAAEAPGAESAPNSDGPGGHADEPGNPSADHQAQGVE
jgi:hypothetical protein